MSCALVAADRFDRHGALLLKPAVVSRSIGSGPAFGPSAQGGNFRRQPPGPAIEVEIGLDQPVVARVFIRERTAAEAAYQAIALLAHGSVFPSFDGLAKAAA